jgi:hypothetical protein
MERLRGSDSKESGGAAACVIALCGCLFEGSGQGKAIPAKLRASCPENPFLHARSADTSEPGASDAFPGYTFRFAECPATASLTMKFTVYDNDGEAVNRSQFLITAGACRGLQRDSLGHPELRVVWDNRNMKGEPVPSGYYFLFFESDPAPLPGETSQCIFLVNEKDVGKLE